MYWKIIKNVHEAYKGIVNRLADLTDTSAEWWHSHGRAPETFNSMGTGKKWQPIEDYLKAVELYESAQKGAGVMLSEEINQLVRCKYTNCDTTANQRQIVNNLVKESSEAIIKLNEREFMEMNLPELESARKEVAQALRADQHALDVVDAIIRERHERREIYDNNFGNLRVERAMKGFS